MNDYFRQGPDMGKCRPEVSRVPPPLASGSFVKDYLLFLRFTKSAAPGHCLPLSGPWFQVRKN